MYQTFLFYITYFFNFRKLLDSCCLPPQNLNTAAWPARASMRWRCKSPAYRLPQLLLAWAPRPTTFRRGSAVPSANCETTNLFSHLYTKIEIWRNLYENALHCQWPLYPLLYRRRYPPGHHRLRERTRSRCTGVYALVYPQLAHPAGRRNR